MRASARRLFGSLLVLLALIGAGAALLQERAADNAKELLAHIPQSGATQRTEDWNAQWQSRKTALLEDLHQLALLAPLQPSGDRSDAGPELNAMLEWPMPWPSRPRPVLALPAGVVERLANWNAEHVDELSHIDFAAIDLSWMSRLSQYDHWDLERHSPYDDLSPNEYASSWFTDREPRLEVLTSWVKLRLMKGLGEDNVWSALSESRQLARLLLSTESLVGTVEAVVILALERKAYEAVLARDALAVPTETRGWKPIGNDETFSASVRALRALPALFTLNAFTLNAGTLNSLSLNSLNVAPDNVPGYCAALREAATTALWLRPFLAEAEPGYYGKLDALVMGGSGCRLVFLKRAFVAFGLRSKWHLFGKIDNEGRPLPKGETAPLARRLAWFGSASLRAAEGEWLMQEYGLRALGAGD